VSEPIRQSDYQFISADTLQELELAVNKKLEEGFMVVGRPIRHNFHVGQGRLHQAVVKDYGAIGGGGGQTIVKETIVKHEKDKRPSGVTEDDENKWRPTWEEGEDRSESKQ